MEKKNTFLSYKLMDWARDITSLGNPFILLFIPFIFLGLGKPFYILLVALAINEIIGSFIKIIFPKTRPNGQKYSNIIEKIDAGSFPSLHSSRMAVVYLTMFSNAENFIMQVLFILVILMVMLSRVALKKHFFIDIIGGFIIGLIIWWMSINFY